MSILSDNEAKYNRYKTADIEDDDPDDEEITEEDIKKMLEEIKDEYEAEAKREKENQSLEIRKQIGAWLERVSFIEFRDAICESVKGQEGVEYILLSVYYYFTALKTGTRHNNHVLVAAPSGCGKSATYLALREYFKKEIPALVVNRIDVANITEAGYRGDDPSSILRPLFDKLPDQNGEGILFLDEFDKKMVPSTSSRGENTNLAVQGQFLSMLEGSRISEEKNPTRVIDSANTLFIAMGSFDSVRKKRKSKSEGSQKCIGFCQKEGETYDHFQEITRDDILEMGSTYELMGRFPILVNYHPLSENTIQEIIDDQKDKIASLLSTTILLDSSFKRELLAECNSPYGCRNLYNRIYTLSLKACRDILMKGMKTYELEIILKSGGEYHIQKKKTLREQRNI